MDMNIFEYASRRKLRFTTVRGVITTEDLWSLPLLISTPTRDVKFDLNTIAQTINNSLKAFGEESFVQSKTETTVQTDLKVSLEIVKHIIAQKQAEAKANEEKAIRLARKRKLLEVLEAKDNASIEGMSREDILKELETL